ncbi:MAG: hypothetical protein NVS2B17_24780 [Candidatus Velthaea sp.]
MLPAQEAAYEVQAAEKLFELGDIGSIAFDVRRGTQSFWIVASIDRRQLVAHRAGYGLDPAAEITISETNAGRVLEARSAFGALRVKIGKPHPDAKMIRCTTSVLASDDVPLPYWPRDLYLPQAPEGTIHAVQRGLRSGVLFLSAVKPAPFSIFYFQDFSSLTAYFDAVKRSPKDTVGGRWPDLGFLPPAGKDCILPAAREIVLSDAYVFVTATAPATEGEVAAQYLDMFAETYLAMPRPETTYHDWPERATRALRDVSFSPLCTYERGGRRHLMPYVGDTTKPPESMVQLTALLNTLEYDRWSGTPSDFAAILQATIPAFFNEKAGSVVRWLPGESFGPQAEEHMDHTTMDSWYLYHSLFNVSRLASMHDSRATESFRQSLPFAMRVARRFDYRWPIFFDLHTLDIVRAESEPGKGGERDVAGIYALVMLHAHELFGDEVYLAEAERAAASLIGLGFQLGYQMNTTGFAAEAMLRLWQKTKNRTYLELSEICMANLFDNMWLWRCDYGRAEHYRLFFGLFPLHDAPYLAAYEELEAHAKFHEYLSFGGDDVRPSLKLLLAEFQKYCLDRAWYYYPDALPTDAIAPKSRNGRNERALSIPIEDMQDGWSASGQVGQELYGAGLPFVLTSRHYGALAETGHWLFCEYPVYDVRTKRSRGKIVVTGRTGGDPRGSCALRIVPRDGYAQHLDFTVTVRAGRVDVPLDRHTTAEGHAVFTLRGGQALTVGWESPR